MGVEPVIMSAGELESERAGKQPPEDVLILDQLLISFCYFYHCVACNM